MRPVLVLIALLCLHSSCKKKNIPHSYQCDAAQLCIENRTEDTIYFAWNSTFLEDSIMPGEIRCHAAGSVEKRYNSRTGHLDVDQENMMLITTSNGSWYWGVDHCYEKAYFEFDGFNTHLYQEEN